MMMPGIALSANVFTVLLIGIYRVLEAGNVPTGISKVSTHIGRLNERLLKECLINASRRTRYVGAQAFR